MEEPGRVVSELTSDVEVQYVYNEDDYGAFEVSLHGKLGAEHVVAVTDPECDVVVLQRPAHRHLVETIPLLQQHGCAVVVDYDDDFDSIHPKNQAWSHYQPETNPQLNKVWAKLASNLADLVTVTTPALAKRYGQHGRVATLPNYVPESYLKVEPSWPTEHMRNVPSIGWAGNPGSHPGDLEVMGAAIHDLTFDKIARFKTIGTGKTNRIVSARHPDTVVWAPIDEFPSLTASFDIGVVPLADSTFNRAKSWLKGLEYAALGVPFVASPTAPYRQLERLGAGDLVTSTTKNTNAWKRALLRYVEDEEYRRLRSEEGRIVASDLTYENHGEEWLQAWGNALTLRRAR
jgi:glycosyltransferase involved in cell wall biosynthesis